MAADVSFAVRVPAELLRQVRIVARSRDETVSQVLRRLMRLYVASQAAQLDLEVAIAEAKAAALPRPPRSGKTSSSE